jgi:hypothetical protein
MNYKFFLANGLGAAWKAASKKAVAGMALIALAKDAELKSLLIQLLRPGLFNGEIAFMRSMLRLTRFITARMK